VRAILVLALLVVGGFILAGCGSSKGAVAGTITVTATTTISNIKVGTLLRCRGGPAARVPAEEGVGSS
jgi:hypothetical protein